MLNFLCGFGLGLLLFVVLPFVYRLYTAFTVSSKLRYLQKVMREID